MNTAIRHAKEPTRACAGAESGDMFLFCHFSTVQETFRLLVRAQASQLDYVNV